MAPWATPRSWPAASGNAQHRSLTRKIEAMGKAIAGTDAKLQMATRAGMHGFIVMILTWRGDYAW